MSPRMPIFNAPPMPDSPLNIAIRGRDSDILAMVRDAVEHREALLAYQPIVHADGAQTPAFHEGLIRILDSTGRIIPANQFMDVVENTELGRDLDTLTLSMGCYALRKVPSLRLSLNMSARSIGYTPWTTELDRWLKRDESIGPRLILEITERSAMTVPELVVSFMDRMQTRGIAFALDDFGAGFTALRYFKDFFFDIMKIDGEFIQGIAKDQDNLALVKAILGIGKQFDMMCVAEKVEEAADARILADIGVDAMQGYYFGAPVTNPKWLEDHPQKQTG